MGRLTLNVLLSFAQFEREVTAERIRDKIAASKKKGLWMGGNPPLGYDAVDKKLVINPSEARIVRQIYDTFGSGTCVKSITADLKRRGITSKVRANGRGGKPFSRGAIYKILSSPIYRGLVRQGGNLHQGVHEAIIDDETWRAASDRLAKGKRRDKGASNHPSPLAGKITADGHSLTPSHATKNGRRYRYYISRKLTEGSASDTSNGRRLPAAQVEETVSKVIIEWLRELASEFERTPHDSIDDFEGQRHALQRLVEGAMAADAQTLLWDWAVAISTVTISETSIGLELVEAGPLANLRIGSFPIIVDRDVQFAKRGIGRKLILGDTAQEPKIDPVMIKLIYTVRRWRTEIFDHGASLKDLALRDGVDQGDASRFFQLAFLAPDITLAILEGRQPVSLTAERLKRLRKLPIDWREQRALLGF